MGNTLIVASEVKDEFREALMLEEKITAHLNPRERLSWCLSLLALRYAHVELDHDYSPHCFGFWGWYKEKTDIDQQADIIGGLIYHGESYEEMVKNFTATVSPKKGWGLHT